MSSQTPNVATGRRSMLGMGEREVVGLTHTSHYALQEMSARVEESSAHYSALEWSDDAQMCCEVQRVTGGHEGATYRVDLKVCCISQKALTLAQFFT